MDQAALHYLGACMRDCCSLTGGCGWQLETLRTHIVDPNFAYPEYAERKFHAYNGGNLDWQAVWEIEPATASLAVRVFKNDKLEPEEALSTMRQSFTQGVQASICCSMPCDSGGPTMRCCMRVLLAASMRCRDMELGCSCRQSHGVFCMQPWQSAQWLSIAFST